MLVLTEEQKALLTARLADAEQALHDLSVGRSARVFVDQNGERVEYTAARRRDLTTYITTLKQQLGIDPCTGRAIGVLF